MPTVTIGDTLILVKYEQPNNGDMFPMNCMDIDIDIVEKINTTCLENLILKYNDKGNTHNTSVANGSVVIPYLHLLTHIRQISIRQIPIYYLPRMPFNIIILEIYNTSIESLHMLPETLKQLRVCYNPSLTQIILSSHVESFEAAEQPMFTLTVSPVLKHLRLVHSTILRINRLTLQSTYSCFKYPTCVMFCKMPYPNVNTDQPLSAVSSLTPLDIFQQIQTVNRELEEINTSVIYRLRESSYLYPSDTESPIITALRMASNPLRRGLEYIVEL